MHMAKRSLKPSLHLGFRLHGTVENCLQATPLKSGSSGSCMFKFHFKSFQAEIQTGSNNFPDFTSNNWPLNTKCFWDKPGI